MLIRPKEFYILSIQVLKAAIFAISTFAGADALAQRITPSPYDMRQESPGVGEG